MYITVSQDKITIRNKQTGQTYTLQKGNSYDDQTYDVVGGSSTPTQTQTPSVPYSGNVGGSQVVQLDTNAVGGFVANLRNQVKNGTVDSLAAKSQLQSYLLKQMSFEGGGNFTTSEAYNAYQSAVRGGLTALFSDLGTIRTPSGDMGEVDLEGNFRRTATQVNQSTTSISGGSQSTTKNVLPLDIAGNLGPGSSGADVTKLQNWLKDQGYFPSNQSATGYYGDITKNAVAAWQKAVGINAGADAGYFGPKSRSFLQSYSITSTQTPEDKVLTGLPDFESLPADQRAVVTSIYNAVSSNDQDAATKLTSALEKAKEFADPYFKAQVTVALDTLVRGFSSEDSDLQYKERSLSQKLTDLRTLTTTAKDFLTLDQQAELKTLEQNYQTELENTQNNLAAGGFGDSSRRTKTETLLATTKGDMVESTNRSFAQKFNNLDTNLSTNTRDTQQEIERLRAVSAENKVDLGRKVEQFVGSKNLPSIPGYTPLGGVTGSAEQNYYQDIINATKKFVF